MPPKCKFTREEVIDAALEITRENGFSALTARALGEKLGSSSRPIFSLFQSMNEVQQEVFSAASAIYREYLKQDMTSGKYPVYKASGMGYIRFAKEQRELFKLLFMRARSNDQIEEGEELKPIIDIIMKNTGLSEQKARMFHLEMWSFVHGIAVMIATSYLDWDTDTISDVLTDAYMGLKERFCQKEDK